MPYFYLVAGLYMLGLGIPLGLAMESLDHWLPDNPAYLRRQTQIERVIKADIVVMCLSLLTLLIRHLIPHLISHAEMLALAGLLVGSIFSVILAVFVEVGISAIRR
jgi:hypothetical protein